MRKSIIFISGLFLFIIFSSVSSAQLVQLGLGGGLTDITAPSIYKGSVTNADFGFSDNYHFTIMAKFNIPLAPVIPAVFLDYHILRGGGTYNDTSISTSLYILSFGAEGEYFILPLPFIKPYILADLSCNSFSQLELDIGTGSYVQLSHTNLGGAIGIGAEITFLPKIDFDVSAKYNLYNLTGRQGEEIVRALTVNIVMLF
ncbi:MAG: outer membrane beta-barrel protein [Ignavibacteriaceae bacterium]|jgi:hypothetical protein